MLSLRNTKDISDLRRNIYNTKRIIFSKFPVSQNEVHSMLLTMDIKTHTGEPFILSNDSDKNIIIFSCKANIDFYVKVKQSILMIWDIRLLSEIIHSTFYFT